MPRPVEPIDSLVPSMPETVCCLGVGSRLVGITRYCVAPEEELQFVPRIGGTKNPRLEQIAAMDPDLVLANREENRPEHIEWLEDRFEVMVHTPRTVPSRRASSSIAWYHCRSRSLFGVRWCGGWQ